MFVKDLRPGDVFIPDDSNLIMVKLDEGVISQSGWYYKGGSMVETEVIKVFKYSLKEVLQALKAIDKS